jgi:autotransporter adhesin
VAAGTSTTDAVNFGQLTSVSDNLSTLDSFAVKYDKNTDGSANYQRVTLGGAGAAQPTLLTNLAKGDLTETSTDAVNGSQLYATNQNVAALQSFTNNINNGGGIKYFHSNSTLIDSSATGTDAVAIGGAAVASAKNSVALGANSVADRANSVSVGAAGSERQITNVAAGTATTDAVNVGQLNAVSNSVSTLSAAAIKYDTNADGTPDYANATLGNGNATGTALHNVTAGTSSMDAVNLGQMNDMISQVTNLANGAYNPMFSADGNRDTEAATSSGTHSVASGANAVASGANAIASGASSVASGANAVAVGANASATAKNSVALGAGSVADRANAVSVGTASAGGQRQITNVAAGTEGTDAVNVNQMQQSVNTGVKSAKGYTDALRSDMNSGLSLANNHINSVGAMSSAMAMMAGSAAAIADKDNRFAAGTGVYRDKAAIAIGFQKRFGTNMVLTVGGSTTGEETTGGAGFAFGF